MKKKPQETAGGPVHPFKAIKRAAVPLVAWETPDPAATIISIQRSLNGKEAETIICTWDIMQGLTGVNKLGKDFANEVSPDGPITTGNPSECLRVLAVTIPKQTEVNKDGNAVGKRAVIFFSNAGRFIDNPDVMQGVWNLRDPFKAQGCVLVMLSPSLKLPPELAQDVVTITEELPDAETLGQIVDTACANGKLALEKFASNRARIIDTLSGLSAYAAEQTTCLSMSKDGIDIGGLFERKRKTIEQTPGLQIWRGGETFDDLGGLENLKSFLTKVLTSGKTPIRALLYIDEAEKSLAGAGSDSSGTSQDQLGVLLKIMQDEDLPGVILVGPPGTGKSSIAKAAGNVAGAPVIACDLGAMKGSLVGQSEQRIRDAMNIFKAISQGKGLVIATCNKLASLPPELKRRFSLGCFYIDLPTQEEQTKIWPYWIKRYELDAAQEIPPCNQWTGSEIRACCDVAYRAGMSLCEAASFVVPVYKSGRESIEALRKMAEGNFISASKPGPYQRQETVSAGRRMED